MKKVFLALSLIGILFTAIAQTQQPAKSATEVLQSHPLNADACKAQVLEILKDVNASAFQLSVHCELRDSSYFVIQGISSDCCNQKQIDDSGNSMLVALDDTSRVIPLTPGKPLISWYFTEYALERRIIAYLAYTDVFANAKVTTLQKMANILSKAIIDDLAHNRNCSYLFSKKGIERNGS